MRSIPARRRVVALLLFALAAIASGPAVTDAQEAASDLLLILDASGSMWGQIEGENKIVIARRVVAELVDGMDEGRPVGLVAYGHRREGDCEDIEVVSPLAPLDREALKATVNALNPKGKTPITRAVERAFEVVAGRPGGATVVLVSDGLETCGGDPCKAVRLAREGGAELVLHVVGFDVAGEDVSQLECAAQAGGGQFLSAENAAELGQALEAAVSMPVEVPAGRLVVTALANGELQDVGINVRDAASGEVAASGRTYANPDTNPRALPLADGSYDVEVTAVGLKGAARVAFQVEIADGSTVEKQVDFSSGELSIGVTRNGELSDATYRVLVAGTSEAAASGRTYTQPRYNPATVEITGGVYDLVIKSVEIANQPEQRFEGVTVEPSGSAAVAHEFTSGNLVLGAVRGADLVDATISIVDAAGKPVAGGRTYTQPQYNPKKYVLLPGDYAITLKELRGETRELAVSIAAGETAERIVDFAAQ